MASILLIKGKLCRKQFKCNYLKNQRSSINFLLHFWCSYHIFNILKKRMSLRAQEISKLLTRKKRRFLNVLKCCVSAHPFRNQHVNASQTLLKSAGSSFIRLLHQCSGLVKTSCADYNKIVDQLQNELKSKDLIIKRLLTTTGDLTSSELKSKESSQ